MLIIVYPHSGHRLPLQPNGVDDAVAAAAHAHPAQDDERPGDQKGNGEP